MQGVAGWVAEGYPSHKPFRRAINYLHSSGNALVAERRQCRPIHCLQVSPRSHIKTYCRLVLDDNNFMMLALHRYSDMQMCGGTQPRMQIPATEFV